ncbi:hypothetical protein [Methylobacterium sp. sgz302541]|uniref:hypothetical protein n=1 Tax=unclassified Methylobacterium TaxID=2615210 RepID=UPI003D35700E
MNTRIVSVAAALLIAVAPLSSASARSLVGYGHPGGEQTAAVAPYASEDVIVTGSIGLREADSSAKYGNANQPERSVPQFGTTSGGPAF